MARVKIANMDCGGCDQTMTAALHGVVLAAKVQADLQRREVAETRRLAFAWQDALRQAGFAAQRLEA